MDCLEVKSRILTELHLVNRKGIIELIIFLEHQSDFFIAPASCGHHLNQEGGLAQHSLNVLETMRRLNPGYFSEDTITVCALLHDLCKTNLYKDNLLKNGSRSEAKPYVYRDDCRGLGHGEDSLFILLELGLELSLEEKKAIRWHMGPFDHTGLKNQGDWNDLSKLLFISDYYATTFLEKKQEANP